MACNAVVSLCQGGSSFAEYCARLQSGVEQLSRGILLSEQMQRTLVPITGQLTAADSEA